MQVIITCLAFFLFTGTLFSQSCRDSVTAKTYSSSLFSFDENGFQAITNTDGSVIVALPSLLGNRQELLIFSIQNSGVVQWSRRISEPEAFTVGSIRQNQNRIVLCLETFDKSIVVACDERGNLLWQKTYSTNTGFGYINLVKIDVDSYGNIFLESVLGRNVSVTRINLQGEIDWSNTYSFGADNTGNLNISGIHVINDSLYLLGAYDKTLTTGIGEVGVWLLNLVSFNGTLTDSKSYVLNNAAPFQDSISYRTPGKSFYAAQKNELVFCPEFIGTDAIVRFDLNLNPIGIGSQLVVNDPILYFFENIDCNDNGIIAYSKSQIGTTSYFALLDENNDFIKQRKLDYEGRIRGDAVFSLLPDNSLIPIVSSDEQNSLVFEVRHVSAAFTDSFVCGQQDTLFVSKQPLLVSASSLTWHINEIVTNSNLINAQQNDFAVENKLICKKESICDSMKIKGDTSFCVHSTGIFKINKNNSCFRNNVWSIDSSIVSSASFDSDNSLSIIFSQPWKGYLHAKINGCRIEDSLFITIHQPSAVNIIGDTILCSGGHQVLHAGSEFKSYKWQDGSIDSNLIVYSAGEYFVTVTDSCNNGSSDTITIIDSKLSLLDKHQAVSICRGIDTVLMANSGFLSYKWVSKNLKDSSSMKFIKINSELSDVYIVSAISYSDCLQKDSIAVQINDCPNNLLFPSAFTPNGDGVNDIFRPVIKGIIKRYKLSVFNRFGQLVYHSDDPKPGWDGYISGKLQSPQTFVWMCELQTANSFTMKRSGTVTLIR